jgi:hypothetical protein
VIEEQMTQEWHDRYTCYVNEAAEQRNREAKKRHNQAGAAQRGRRSGKRG